MLTLRRTYPDDDRFWTVQSEGVTVGSIIQPTGQKFWHWSITVQFPAGNKNGKSDSRQEAMIEFRQAWESYREQLGPEQWAQHVAHMAELAERAKGW
jgi:hypothetical protein